MFNRCSNAKWGPQAAYNAYEECVKTTTLFLTAAMDPSGLQDVTGKWGIFIT